MCESSTLKRVTIEEAKVKRQARNVRVTVVDFYRALSN
jgi:hypothetical protein